MILDSKKLNIKISQSGPRGPMGLPPSVSKYNKANASIATGGILNLDVSLASTFYVVLNQHTIVNISGWPAGGNVSQVVKVYFQQDSTGGWEITSWPSEILWSGGYKPQITSSAYAIDCVAFDSFDGGETIFGQVVGRDYKVVI